MSAEQPPQHDLAEISQYEELRYARDLFVHLFRDGAPFSNLGYGPAQVQTALTALRQLENEKGHVRPYSAYFADEDQHYSSAVHNLKYGGWQLRAHRNIYKMLKDTANNSEDDLMIFAKYVTHKPRVPFFDNESIDTVVIVDMLPPGENCENIEKLVPNLYITTGFSGWGFDTMNEDATVSRIKSKLMYYFRQYHSTYKAAWVDDETKLDLVVLHGDPHIRDMAKYGSYGEDQKEGKLDIWRRLPEQELYGKVWAPFGRKVNASASQAMRAFESKQNVVTGKLALAPQRF